MSQTVLMIADIVLYFLTLGLRFFNVGGNKFQWFYCALLFVCSVIFAVSDYMQGAYVFVALMALFAIYWLWQLKKHWYLDLQ